jgi:hypothetical protein
MTESKKKTNTNKRTIKEVYDESKETNALKLSELANTTVSYAKQFLKKQNEAFEVVGKIDLKNTNDVPCGSSINNHWQADVMFLHDYKNLRDNKNHVGILTLLNTTTRQARAQPVKSTQTKEINKAMMNMIISIDFDIAVLRTDGGTEFTNNEFKKMIEELGITIEYAEAHTHAWLNRTNRFHRTLKELIRNQFIENGNKNIWPSLFTPNNRRLQQHAKFCIS